MIKDGWLYPSPKIYIAKSKIHGLGVFANEDLEKGDIIEIAPILNLGIKSDKEDNEKFLYDYRFNYIENGVITKLVISLGYGSLYNHSDVPNADWRLNKTLDMFEFFCKTQIKKHDEILIYYGDEKYWKMRSYINKNENVKN